ncbi:hypothetical protein ACFQ0D_21455, partial [Micromonospora zhanjiangensis]
MRARRLATIAAVAVMGALSLSGCGTDPDVALYVDGHSYSRAEVDAVAAEIPNQTKPEQVKLIRGQVVQLLAVRDSIARYAKNHDITVPAPDVAGYAQESGLPADKRHTELLAGIAASLTALQQAAPSVAPSEADQREALANSTVQGQPVTDQFEAVQKYLGKEQLGKVVGVRNALREAFAEAKVTVNPGFGDQVFQVPGQIGQVNLWLGVPVRGTESPVTDLPTSAAPT